LHSIIEMYGPNSLTSWIAVIMASISHGITLGRFGLEFGSESS
jgi:hypothetical protein